MALLIEHQPSLPNRTGYGPHKRKMGVGVVEEKRKSVAELVKLGKDSLGRAVRKGKEEKPHYIVACAYFMEAEIRMNSEGDTSESRKVTSALSEFTYRLYVACESVRDYRFSAVTDASCTARKWLEIIKRKTSGPQSIGSGRDIRNPEISDDTTRYRDEFVKLLEFVSESCVEILGHPPCDFSHVLLAELDIESALDSIQNHYVALSNDVDKKKVAEYFDWYFTLFQCIVLGVSESLRKYVINSANTSKPTFQNEVISWGTVDDMTRIAVQRYHPMIRAKLVRGSRRIYEKFLSGIQNWFDDPILHEIAKISNGVAYLEELLWSVGRQSLSFWLTIAKEIVEENTYLKLHEENFFPKVMIMKSIGPIASETDKNDELREAMVQLKRHVQSMIQYLHDIEAVVSRRLDTLTFQTEQIRLRIDELCCKYIRKQRKMKPGMQYALDPIEQQESLAWFIEKFMKLENRLKNFRNELVLLLTRMIDINQGLQDWRMDANARMKIIEQEEKISTRLEKRRQCAIVMIDVVQYCRRERNRRNPTKLIDQPDSADVTAEDVLLLNLVSVTNEIIKLHADTEAIKSKLLRKLDGTEKKQTECLTKKRETNLDDYCAKFGSGDAYDNPHKIKGDDKGAYTNLELLLRKSTNPKEAVEICQRHRGNDLRAIRSIMVSGEELNSETIKDISAIVECCDHAIELEFRACDLKASLLDELHERIKTPKCQIAKFTIGMTSAAPAITSTALKFARAKRVRMLCLDQTDFSAKNLDDIIEGSISPSFRRPFDSPFACLTSIDISYNKNIDDFSLLGKALWSNHILHLKMVDCNLQDGQMDSLRQAITEGLVTDLNISYNESLTEDGYRSICGILSTDFVESLKLCGCELSDSGMSAIRESLAKVVQINSFDLSYNGPVSEGWMKEMCTICKKHEVRRGTIAGCDLAPEHMQWLEESLKTCQLVFLDLSDNPAIRSRMKQLGIIVKDAKLQEFSYADCMLSPENVLELVKGLDGYKVKSVDLSDWERNSTVKYVEAIRELVPLVERNLKLCLSHMNEECRGILQNCVDLEGSEGLKILLSKPSQRTIEMNGFTIVLENEIGDEVVQTRKSKFDAD